MNEITYEIILKHLVKDDHIFITPKNIINKKFTKFNDIFTDLFFRYGITIYDINKNNISFWTSLLTLLDENYMTSCNNEDLSIITEYKMKLIDGHSKKISSFLKKFEKNDFREYFKLQPDLIILQYIVDILNINILIFDFKLDEIFALYRNDIMDPFNKIILLAKYDDFWEPIMTSETKSFDYNNDIIINILKKNIKYYESDKINKIFNFSTKPIEDVKISKKKKPVIINSESNVDTMDNTNSPVVYSKISKSKLERMKNEDLIKILEVNNIEYKTDAKILKKNLIDLLILNNLV